MSRTTPVAHETASERAALARYFAVAYAVSWALWAPLVLADVGWIDRTPPDWWHYAGAAGPITGAVVASALGGGRTELARLAAQFDPRRVSPAWWAVTLLSPVALFVLGTVVARIIDGAWIDRELIGRTGNLPAMALPLTWLVHTLTFGIGEETGWRGFALPRLERAGRSAFRATAILTLFWAAWHIPAFVYSDNLGGLGIPGTVGWLIGLFAGALFFTWLYHRTRAGLLAIVIWHGTFNTLIASEAAEGTVAAVMTTVLMVAVIVIVAAEGPTRLGRRTGRQAPGTSLTD